VNSFTRQELPQDWVWTQLNYICEAVHGVTFDADEVRDSDFGASIACLTTASIQEYIDWDTRRFIPTSRLTSKRQIVQNGDILVSTANSINLVGKSCLADHVPAQYTFGAFVTLLRPSELVDPYFLAGWLRTSEALQYFIDRSYNTTNIANLRTKELLELPIPLPPLPEQQRIVKILYQTDKLRRLRREADDRARALLPALFQEMFGDCNPNSELPKGWVPMVLGDLVADMQYGISSNMSDTGDIAILRMNNITADGQVDLSNLKYLPRNQVNLPTQLLENGDILFNRTNSVEHVGKTGIWRQDSGNYTFASYIIRIKAHQSVGGDFIWAFLNSAYGKYQLGKLAKQAVNMANINSQELATIPIALPPKDVRDRFSEIVATLQDAATNRRHSSQLIDELSAALSALAFTGELTAEWREQHTVELRIAAQQRDALLNKRMSRSTKPSAEERVQIKIRGKAGKSVEELMQGLFDTVRLTWDVPTTTLPQPMIETSRGLIGQVLAQSTQRIADTLTAPVAELTHTTTVRMSDTLAKPISDFMRTAYADNVPISFEEEISGHPREHLLRRLTVRDLLVWLTINAEASYVTLESLCEATGLTHKALERILDMLVASGLITAVCLPANPSGKRVFVPAYRAFDAARDEARARDLKLLEAR
jgi:type I restriction enzyme, S subunit